MNVTIPELITKLNYYKDYENLTKSNYRKRIGNKDDLIKTLSALESKKLTHFEHFEELLPELQSMIMSQNNETLKKSQMLNKSVTRYTQQEYYQRYCNLPISKKEIVAYQPDKMYILVNHRNTVTQERFLIINTWARDDNDYRQYLPKISIKNNIIVYIPGITYHIQNINNIDIDFTSHLAIDLLTVYKLLKARHCETIKPGYAKSKILNALKKIQNINRKNDYYSWMNYWMYLTVNCKQFPILQKEEIFKKLRVTVDNDGEVIMVEGAALTGEALMLQLQESCAYWLKQLWKWVELLD